MIDPEQGDVVLHRPLIGEPQQRATIVAESVGEISRREASAHIGTVSTQPGVYEGRFFCMKAGCPGRTRTTDSGLFRRLDTSRADIAST